MKEVLAAPASFLPSALTALAAQESAMHFFMNEVFAAPASGLPSLPMALVSQDASCAIAAEPRAKVARTVATKIRFIGVSPLLIEQQRSKHPKCRVAQAGPHGGHDGRDRMN